MRVFLIILLFLLNGYSVGTIDDTKDNLLLTNAKCISITLITIALDVAIVYLLANVI